MTQQRFRIADPQRVEKLLDQMANRVLAELGNSVQIVGIRRRGVPLAQQLAGLLNARCGTSLRVAELTLKRYSDELVVLHREPQLEQQLTMDIRGATVLLVDDVLYSGWTLFRAAEHALAAGAAAIHCAVLCERGPLEVPIKADFVGLRLDVGPHGIVEVEAPPYESELAVLLSRKPTAAG